MIPEENCSIFERNIECVANADSEEALRNKGVITFTNNMYFQNREYSADSPIKKTVKITK